MITAQTIRLATHDILGSIRMWRVWYLIGTIDVRQRYRRSVLGPFWACLSMGMQALVTGLVMSVLFKQPTQDILPYVCLSLIIWGLVQNVVNEGAQTFINAGEFMLQVNRPYGVYIFRTVWGNLLVSSHMILVYFVVAFLYGLYPGWTYVLALPGLALLVLNLVWMAFAAAILSARFRDIPMIIQNLFTVLFWLTPVVYRADQLGGTVEQLARLNPLFHILEVARQPLLLREPALESWLVAAASAIVGWCLTLLLFARTRRRIVYWM